MSLRVGKRVGNTYVSTNGNNVRVTGKVCKGVYVSKQFGSKNSSSKEGGSIFGCLTILVLIATAIVNWKISLCIIGAIVLIPSILFLISYALDKFKANTIQAVVLILFFTPIIVVMIMAYNIMY